MRPHAAVASALQAFSGAALAHSAPQSFVTFEFREHSVHALLLVPESEYAAATAEKPGVDTLAPYLLRHVSAQAPAGKPWTIDIQGVRNTSYLEHRYLAADVVLTPPVGTSAQSFTFGDDAVTHEVRNHLIVVVARSAGESRLLGTLQYPARQLTVEWPAVKPAR